MKTYYIFSRRFSLFLLAGILTLSFISCGTYQNSGLEDRDGIYSNSQRGTDNNYSASGIGYKNYFESKQDTEVLTDVENYSSNNYNEENPNAVEQNYGGWGSDSDNVTVNIYQDSWGYNNYYTPYWGYSSWYGPGWGFGWNNFGWGGNYGWGGGYGRGGGKPFFGAIDRDLSSWNKLLEIHYRCR